MVRSGSNLELEERKKKGKIGVGGGGFEARSEFWLAREERKRKEWVFACGHSKFINFLLFSLVSG